LRILGNGKLSGGFQSDCPATREILNLVGAKWSTLVVVFLGHRAQRFNALKVRARASRSACSHPRCVALSAKASWSEPSARRTHLRCSTH
jgi:hypothetical protein